MGTQAGMRPGGPGGHSGGWDGNGDAEGSAGGPFRAFKSRDYTAYWVASLLSITSFFMLIIARGWLVIELTDSELWVGLVAAAAQLPSLILSVFGGVIADRFNRKNILLVSEAFNFTTLIILALLVAFDVIEVWHLLVLAMLNGITFALAFPARAAIVPSLVPPRDIANGTALSSIMFSGAALLGPPAAGFLLLIEPSLAFFGAAVSVGLGVPMFMLMRLRQPAGMGHFGRPQGSIRENIMEGMRYIRNSQILLALMVMGFVAVFFGMPYQTMLPVFAEKVLDVGPGGLGLLGATGGIGAIAGSLVIATFSTTNQLKMFLIVGAFGLGVTIIGFSLSPIFAVSLAFALGAGWFFQLVMTSNFALLQVLTPDNLRGRVLSIRFIVFGTSPFAILMVAAFAETAGAPIATALTGVLVLAASAIAIGAFPSLRSREQAPVEESPAGDGSPGAPPTGDGPPPSITTPAT